VTYHDGQSGPEEHIFTLCINTKTKLTARPATATATATVTATATCSATNAHFSPMLRFTDTRFHDFIRFLSGVDKVIDCFIECLLWSVASQ
jgi:hypothetical protein